MHMQLFRYSFRFYTYEIAGIAPEKFYWKSYKFPSSNFYHLRKKETKNFCRKNIFKILQTKKFIGFPKFS